MKPSKTSSEPESKTRAGLRKLIPVIVFVVSCLVAWLVTHDDSNEHPVARAISCLLAAGLVILWRYLPVADKTGGLVRRYARTICGLLLVAWAGTTVGATLSFELERILSRGSIRVHTTFHYYMGPKYFAELGYTDLYEQSLAADHENARYWTGSISRIRDLRTYQKHHLSQFRIQRSEAFSDERWQEFGEDVRRIQVRRSPVVWRGIFSDRGYNATPFGVAVGRLVSQVPSSKLGLAFLGLLDPLLLLVAFIFLGRAFGSRKALLAAGWFLIFYGNEHHLIGRMFIHDYLIALLFMAWAIKRERPATAGVFLAYATMVRVFPGALLVGLLVWSVIRRLRDGKIPSFSKRLVVSFSLACTLFGLLSFANGRGPQAWVESIDNLKLHGQHHRFGNRRIGLQHLFVHDWSHGFKAEPKASRKTTWPTQRWAWMLSGVLCLGLWGWRMWKHTPDDPLEAMLLGLVIVFLFLVLSRYYWVVACLMLLLGNRTRAGPRQTWLQAGLFLHVALFYFWSIYVGSDFSQYLGANLLWLAWLAAAMILPFVLKSKKPAEVSAS